MGGSAEEGDPPPPVSPEAVPGSVLVGWTVEEGEEGPEGESSEEEGGTPLEEEKTPLKEEKTPLKDEETHLKEEKTHLEEGVPPPIKLPPEGNARGKRRN